MMNRRQAARLALAGLAGVAGCRRRGAGPHAADKAPTDPSERLELEGRELAPVTADDSFRIRSVTGLRPFRPSGFVVRREDIGGKTLIHNYGHGGGGISLSWGSADLAVQLAEPVTGVSCAVVGGGVMGLSTARLLQLRGATVTVYARDLPPETTSNVAGGHWWPVSVFDSRRRTEAFTAQYLAAANFAFDYFQKLVGTHWGIRWVPSYYLSEHPPANGWMSGPGGALHHLQVGFRDFGPGEHVFPRAWARRFHTMLIEPHTYLQALMRDVLSAGGRIEIRELAAAPDVLGLPHPVIFNCSGLGARSLFGDEELIPVKGQLEVMMPQPEVNYNLVTDSYYMFPRADGIVLGGTFDRGNWDLSADPAVGDRIRRGNRSVFEEMRKIQLAHAAPR